MEEHPSFTVENPRDGNETQACLVLYGLLATAIGKGNPRIVAVVLSRTLTVNGPDRDMSWKKVRAVSAANEKDDPSGTKTEDWICESVQFVTVPSLRACIISWSPANRFEKEWYPLNASM